MNRSPAARRALLLECGVVLAVAWLPLFVGARVLGEVPERIPAKEAIYHLTIFGGAALLYHYLIWKNGESFRRLGWRRFRLGRDLGWTLLAILASVFVVMADYNLFGPYSGEAGGGRYEGGLRVVLYLAGALFEETFYRGYLWQRFRRLCGSGALTLLATSVFFAASHPYPLRDLLFVFNYGIMMGLLRAKSRSLLPLILAHAAFNLSLG